MRNKAIERFYNSVKLGKVIETGESEPPITHVRVFYKEYPRLPSVDLPDVAAEGEFYKLLEERRSVREFSSPISVEELSKVLYACRIVDPGREPERRTYPSAGARFPIEIYPVVFDVNGLERGAYHYNVPKHKLELLWEHDFRGREAEFVSPFLSDPSAALVFTAVLARSDVKYGNKAYPYALIEAGHIGQNIQLACTKYGIGCCPVGGFVNDSVSGTLDLTEDEIPVYVLGVGK